MRHELVSFAFLLLSLFPTAINAVQCNVDNALVCDQH